MVRRVFPLLLRSLADLWDNVLTLTVCNAMWALSALPGIFILFLGPNIIVLACAVAVLVASLGPSTAGLFYVTADVTRRERVELREYFTGVRRFYRRGLVLAALNGVFLVLAYFNLAFYSSTEIAGTPISLLSILWVYLLVVWFTMQIYMWPLALRMEKLKIGLLLRNSALATFKYPFFSLLIALFLLLLLAASFFSRFIVTVIIGATFQAIVCNKAVAAVLEQEQLRQEQQLGRAGLAMEVPPPLHAEEEILESKPVPTVNTPPGVTRRSTSISRNTTNRKDK